MTTTQALITAATQIATDVRLKRELIAENDRLKKDIQALGAAHEFALQEVDKTGYALSAQLVTLEKERQQVWELRGAITSLEAENDDLRASLDLATQARRESGVCLLYTSPSPRD